MLILRYFTLVLLYHLVSFYQQKPWAFFMGILEWPYYVVTRMTYPVEIHADVVRNGLKATMGYWESDPAMSPPRFLLRRFEALRRELGAESLGETPAH